MPRDRKAEFEPQIVGKHQRRFDGFDDKILSMYARGMSTREIQGHLIPNGILIPAAVGELVRLQDKGYRMVVNS